KVLDFGVAKLADTDINLGATLEGAIVGTPAYMAPEQARGESVDFRSDVYAVGTVLYQLIAGRPPFEGRSFGQLVVQITNDLPPPLPALSVGGERVPPGLAERVMQCLEK